MCSLLLTYSIPVLSCFWQNVRKKFSENRLHIICIRHFSQVANGIVKLRLINLIPLKAVIIIFIFKYKH